MDSLESNMNKVPCTSHFLSGTHARKPESDPAVMAQHSSSALSLAEACIKCQTPTL